MRYGLRALLFVLPTFSLLTVRENSANAISLHTWKFWDKSYLTKSEDALLNEGDDGSISDKNNSNGHFENGAGSINVTKNYHNSEDVVIVTKNSSHIMANTDYYEPEETSEEALFFRRLGSALFEPPQRSNGGKTHFRRRPSHQGWGTHPIGTREDYTLEDAFGHLKWIAYFYDQAVATVLQDVNDTMIKCTVQENIEKWEQDTAFDFLGGIMPLVPLKFNAMVHLITLCGTLNMPPKLSRPTKSDSVFSLMFDMSALHGIFPGTLWCGMQDRAKHFSELGSRPELDSCCRAHDVCPIKIRAWKTRYGVSNTNFRALLHCSCDLEFFRCLKAAKKPAADMVGKIYFNYLETKCLDAPSKRQRRRTSSIPSGSLIKPFLSILRRSVEHMDAGVSPKSSVRMLENESVKVMRHSREQPSTDTDVGRLDCALVDSEGGCRRWELTPRHFSVQLAVTTLDLLY